jgi:ligand-binding sensor domain-containing protein/signal transduction histidine kinase
MTTRDPRHWAVRTRSHRLTIPRGFRPLARPVGLTRAVVWCLLTALAMAVCSPQWIEASAGGNAVTSIRFEQLGVDDGLSDSNMTCALQDNVGFLWFGTDNGLNRYDGYDFSIFTHDPSDGQSLGADEVSALYQDQAGTLWIGTAGGGLDAFVSDQGRFIHYVHDPELPSLSSNTVTAIVGGNLGQLWIATWGGGMDRFNPATGEFFHYRASSGRLSSDEVYTLYLDRSGILWIGTTKGLDKLDLPKGEYTHFDIALPEQSGGDLPVRAVTADPDGSLWLGTGGGGLLRFNPADASMTQYLTDPQDLEGYAYNDIVSLLLDRTGILWVGTDGGGLYTFDRETGLFLRHPTDPRDSYSISSNYVETIYQDRQDILWIGTQGGGINKYDRSSQGFTHYQNHPNDPNSLGHNRVLSVLEDRNGVLWIGTDGRGLDRFDRQTGIITHIQNEAGNPNTPSSNYISSLWEDHLGFLWLGTWGEGLDRFDPITGEFLHFQTDPNDPDSLSHQMIWPIFEDRSGRLWIGTFGGGLNKLDRETGQFAHWRHDPDDASTLLSDLVTSIFEDGAGTLWIGTAGGVNRYDPTTNGFVRYPEGHGAPAEPSAIDLPGSITAIRQDSTAALWVANSVRGIATLDAETGEFEYITEENGLPSNTVASLEIDDEGFLWVSTAKGLAKFDPRTKRVRSYGARDGLQGYQFTFGSSHRGQDGEMFFGGTTGLDVVQPLAIRENAFVPPIVLTKLTQGGIAIAAGPTANQLDDIRLRWPNNYFEFEFAALNYIQPEKNQYAYMLEGFDADWIYVGNRRFGQYTNLPGGEYTLRIKGSNNDQIWNELGTAIKITIVPPFWEAWWFLATLGVVAAGTAFFGYRLRVRGIQARSRELETLVKDRTAELRQRTHQLQERTAELEERNIEIDRRRQELEALYRADAELDRCLHLEDVLRALVDIAIEMLQADKSSFFVWDPDRDKLVIGMARGFQPDALSRLSFALGEGTVGQVAASGQPMVVQDARHDERIGKPELIIAEGIRSFMQVPIRVGGRIFGVFSADYIQPRAFGDEEQRLFLALAQRAGLAIETVQRYEHSQQLAVVEERSRLARELHDAVTQTLFSASLIAEALPGALERGSSEARDLLQELRQLTRGALAEMRTLLLELRPAALVEASLADLLRQLGEAVTGREGVQVDVVTDGSARLQPDVHVVFYRVAQEALNNVVKHARADRVHVLLSHEAGPDEKDTAAAELRIRDNGRGFDPNCPAANCFGLRIMRERAESIGAALVINSVPGQGTEILLAWRQGKESTGDRPPAAGSSRPAGETGHPERSDNE